MSSIKELDESEDFDYLNGGDLGLGRGLKPGGIAFFDESVCETNAELKLEGLRHSQANDLGIGVRNKPKRRTGTDSDQLFCGDCTNTSLYVIKCDNCRQEVTSDDDNDVTEDYNDTPFSWQSIKDMNPLMTHLTKANPVPKLKRLTRSKSDPERDLDGETDTSDFPVLNDVPLGTSIRQQKKLYELNRKELFDQGADGTGQEIHPQVLKKQNPEKLLGLKDEQENASTLAKKLIAAERDIEILRYELETCKKVSESRCKAMRLFKGHSYAIQTQHMDSAKKTSQLNKALQAEINQLQFELEYKEAAIVTSQEMWTDRFQKISQENFELKAKVNEQASTIRTLQAEKTALIREQDELIALLDVQERQRYEASRSQSSDDNSDYNNFTSTELAVLGACRCRIHKPQPCGCAHAAAYMKREITKQRIEMAAERQKGEEATIMADAYRIAFEEQLNRNTALMRQLVDFTSSTYWKSQPHNVGKARAALRWLVKQLNEEDYLPVYPPPDHRKDSKVSQTSDQYSTEAAQHNSVPQESPTHQHRENSTQEGAMYSENFKEGEYRLESDKAPHNNTGQNGFSNEEKSDLTKPVSTVIDNDERLPSTDVEAKQYELHSNRRVYQSSGITGIKITEKGEEQQKAESSEQQQRFDDSRRSSSLHSIEKHEMERLKGSSNDIPDGLDDKKEEELIDMLLDMMKDRTEALAHQRLAARMLAKRLTEVEQKLATLTGENSSEK